MVKNNVLTYVHVCMANHYIIMIVVENSIQNLHACLELAISEKAACPICIGTGTYVAIHILTI